MHPQFPTEATSLLHAPAHVPLRVVHVGFDAVRARARELALDVGTALSVRGRADAFVLVEREGGALVSVDLVTARFIGVTAASGERAA